MKKYYLANYITKEIETMYFESPVEALEEARKRDRKDPNCGWNAYDEQGQKLYGLCIVR